MFYPAPTEEEDPAVRQILTDYRRRTESAEKSALFSGASLSVGHQRREGAENDYRLPYKRDVDRIVHSKAYARYNDKTQVAYLVANDHITVRALHVQLVAGFARGIAEILRLNTNLVEAIALGHDVGHPPFGHEGEMLLSGLSEEFGNGPFAHPWQSCRLFSMIEPLNLGLAVYDGFLCHDGGMQGNVLTPNRGKTWADHDKELAKKKLDPDFSPMPATLEGCLVKVCDTISYLGRDIEDAISLGLLTRDQVPDTILGNTNRNLLRVIATDIIKNSYDKDVIAMSEEVYSALKTLREFNFSTIYFHPALKVEAHKVRRSYRILFTLLLEDAERKGEESYVWKEFVYSKSESYRSSVTPVQSVVDYISGMTNNYYLKTFERLVMPSKIDLHSERGIISC